MNWALIDYSPLKSLENQFLSVVRVGTLTDNKLKFRDRMILVGDASEPQHPDHFNIGDLHPQPLAGIYLHACAAITALGSPLLELTRAGRFAGYLSFALVTMGAISAIRLSYSRHPSTAQVKVRWRYNTLTGVTILASWLFAAMFVSQTRVIWTDFTAVTAGLLLHLYLRHRLDLLHGWPNRVLNYQIDPQKPQST